MDNCRFLRRILNISLLVILAGLLAACAGHKKSAATTPEVQNQAVTKNKVAKNEVDEDEIYIEDFDHEPKINIDPYENFNRKVFAFNRGVDKFVMRPVAKTYEFVTPTSVQIAVNNFFNNLAEISHIINDLLQFNLRMVGHDSGRLLLNSTVGVAGLVDVASYMGIQRHEQDMGLTFAEWGDKDSAYCELPILGPSTMRDFVGLVPNVMFFSVWPHIKPHADRYALLGGNIVDARTQLLPTDKLVDQAYDPYIFVRDAYVQHRAHLIKKNAEEGKDPFIAFEHRHGGAANNGDEAKSRSITR